MQSNHYHQPQSPAYLSTINTTSSGGAGGFSHHHHQQQRQGSLQSGGGSGEAQGGPSSLFQSVTGTVPPPSHGSSTTSATGVGATTNEGSRFSTTARSASNALHDETNDKREQRLLKNR